MNWLIVGLAFAGLAYAYYLGFKDGRLQGRVDVEKEEMERTWLEPPRPWPRPEPLRSIHRPDARPVEAQTVDELVFRLVDDGDRLMEGEG